MFEFLCFCLLFHVFSSCHLLTMVCCNRLNLSLDCSCQLALSKNLSQLIVLCFGELVEDFVESTSKSIQRAEHFELQSSSVNRVSSVGLHCFVLKTSIFFDRCVVFNIVKLSFFCVHHSPYV